MNELMDELIIQQSQDKLFPHPGMIELILHPGMDVLIPNSSIGELISHQSQDELIPHLRMASPCRVDDLHAKIIM